MRKKNIFLGFSQTLGNPSGALLAVTTQLSFLMGLNICILRVLQGPFRAPKEAHTATKPKSLTSHLGPLQPL